MNWSVDFNSLLNVPPTGTPTVGKPVTTHVDLSAMTGSGAPAKIFGCDCDPTGNRSGLSQAEMEAAWRANGAM